MAGTVPTESPRSCAQRLVDALGRDHAAVRLLDGLLDGPAGADLEVHLEPGGAAEIVEGHHVQGIGGGDDELPARGAPRR